MLCCAQGSWEVQRTWTGEACSGPETSNWQGVWCSGGRVVGLRLRGIGATGPLDGFAALTALSVLQLDHNKFTGPLRSHSRSLAITSVMRLTIDLCLGRNRVFQQLQNLATALPRPLRLAVALSYVTRYTYVPRLFRRHIQLARLSV